MKMSCRFYIALFSWSSNCDSVLGKACFALHHFKMDYPSGPSGFDWLVQDYVQFWQPTYLDYLFNGLLKVSPFSLKMMWELSRNPETGIKVDLNNVGAFQPYVRWLGPSDSWKGFVRIKLLEDLEIVDEDNQLMLPD